MGCDECNVVRREVLSDTGTERIKLLSKVPYFPIAVD